MLSFPVSMLDAALFWDILRCCPPFLQGRRDRCLRGLCSRATRAGRCRAPSPRYRLLSVFTQSLAFPPCFGCCVSTAPALPGKAKQLDFRTVTAKTYGHWAASHFGVCSPFLGGWRKLLSGQGKEQRVSLFAWRDSWVIPGYPTVCQDRMAQVPH